MNKEHTFYEKDENQNWNVYCKRTTGGFNTILWKQNKIARQTCPCCQSKIR